MNKEHEVELNDVYYDGKNTAINWVLDYLQDIAAEWDVHAVEPFRRRLQDDLHNELVTIEKDRQTDKESILK